MNINLKNIYSALVVLLFVLLAYGSGESSDSPEEKKAEALNDVSIFARTANITYEIKDGTLTAQHIHESIILDKIYYLIMENRVDNINITMTDYCKDFYGQKQKRIWHKNLDKSWSYWEEVKNYVDVDAFSNSLKYDYVLSSDTEEGVFYCCGRDRGCN
jgi:hypothetical protein